MSDSSERQSLSYALIGLRPKLCQMTSAEAKTFLEQTLTPEEITLMTESNEATKTFTHQAVLGLTGIDHLK